MLRCGDTDDDSKPKKWNEFIVTHDGPACDDTLSHLIRKV